MGLDLEFSFTLEFMKQDCSKLNRISFNDDIGDIRILAVEDNGNISNVLSSYLHCITPNVKLLSSGYEAIEEIQRNTYDLLLIDCSLQQKNDIETMKKIKSLNNFDSSTKAILLSDYSCCNMDKEAKDAGVSSIINKPVFLDTLVNTISNLYGLNDCYTRSTQSQQDYPLGFDSIRGAKLLLAEDDEIKSAAGKRDIGE